MNILIGLILLGTLLPLTIADEPGNTSDTVEIDTETQQQIQIMNSNNGAAIRLLQLEKAIIKNIDKGEEIITFLQESNVNDTDLQLILAEFELLLQEVQSADPNASDGVTVFIDLKHDALNLSKEFRERARELMDKSALEQIRNRVQNMSGNKTLDLSNRIRNHIRQFNSQRFCEFYSLLDKNCSNQVEHYRTGSLSKDDVIDNITMNIKQLKKTSQFNILTSLKQTKIQSKYNAENQAQNATEGFQQRQMNRLQKRLHNAENFSEFPFKQELMNRLQNKFNVSSESGYHGDQGGNGNKSGGRENDGTSGNTNGKNSNDGGGKE